MNLQVKKNGFSLTEVLLALGTLTVGLTLISGTFVAGIYLSTVSTERTIASIVANEAFAKIKLYGIDLTDPNISDSSQILIESFETIPEQEYAYPSTKISDEKQYYWLALCRPVTAALDNQLVQVTVFVVRKVGNATYPPGQDRPVPVKVEVSLVSGSGDSNKLTINTQNQQNYINDGCTIVDNRTGQIYRVLERGSDSPDTFTIDREWQNTSAESIWVVPPPIGGGKKPDIMVFQQIIRFG